MLNLLTSILKLNTVKLRIFTVLIFMLFLAILGTKNPEKKAVISRDLASKTISLDNRYSNTWVNSVFKDNILLNLAYLRGAKALGGNIDWNSVEKPFTYSFTLAPGKTFAFHDGVRQEYKNTLVKTTQAHFNSTEGFKSDGFLVGDGVCHLASLIYWASVDAKLNAVAPTNHNFANIPEIPKEYGVAIYNDPSAPYTNQEQNLYITNNKGKPVSFTFTYNGKDLKVTVSQLTTSGKELAYSK